MADRRETHVGLAALQDQALALLARLGAGSTVEFWTGPRPADNQTAPGAGTTLLVTENLATPAGASANGVITFTPPASTPVTAIAPADAARGASPAQWYRVKGPGGVVELSGTAGRPGYAPDGITAEAGSRYNMELGSALFSVGAEPAVTAWTHTMVEKTAG